jgi:hypothetical protein
MFSGLRPGEKTTKCVAPKSARNFIASRALSSTFWRCAGSGDTPLKEMVTTLRPRFDNSVCNWACVSSHLCRMSGNPLRRMPVKPVAFMSSRVTA